MAAKGAARQNWEIKCPEVRLIDEEGNQLGITNIKEARQRAEDVGLDLVEISPNAKPPVCKIMDYGKYCYELGKKEKEAKKKQKQIDVKEVKFTYKIGEHDYQTKLRNCIRFLKKGNKVKVSMFFRGREKAHISLGEKLLDRLLVDVDEFASVDKRTPLVGSMITMVLSPK